MIAKYYGKSVSLRYLRSICDVNRLGVSIKDITDACGSVGLHAVAAKVPLKDIHRMPLPSILYWNQNHFVVLYKINKGWFYIADPSKGKVRIDESHFSKMWINGGQRGLSVLVEPKPEFDSLKFEKDSVKCGFLSLMKKSLSKNKKEFLYVILFSMIAIAADILLPLILQHTIDDGISTKNISLVWLLVLGQLFVGLGSFLSTSVVDVILTKLSLRLSVSLMNEYLKKLIRLPLSFFERKVNSDLIQKTEDQYRIKNFLISVPDMFLFTSLNILVFSGMLIYYNVFVFIIFALLSLVGVVWTATFLRRRREIDYANNALVSENRNNLYELVYGMSEIKTNNAQYVRISVWNLVQEKINKLSMKSTFLRMCLSCGNTLLSRLKDVGIIGICATMVIKGNMTIGVMMTVSYIVGRLSSPVANILSSINMVQDASMSYERVEEVLSSCPRVRTQCVSDSFKNIELKNIWFKYPGGSSPYVLKDISFIVERGKTTAIVGASGCGKTTLIKILLGLFVPQCGMVEVNGKNLIDVVDDDWLRRCGVVMQNGMIFSGTILSNIALSDENPDIHRAIYAAEKACLDGFISTLPMGYMTKIGVSGIELSGGQKQRLFIARALYKNPDILFLDEATSSLDAINESRILSNLEEYKKGRTVVVAAHRLSTVKNADRIIYMENGSIKECGTHEELISLHGDYYTLVKNQLELGE